MKNLSIIKRIIAITIVCSLLSLCVGCGSKEGTKGSGDTAKLTIAYQGGIGYAPVHIMEAKKLIEKNYDGAVDIEFKKLDSGPAINEGMIGGTIDIGCMGIAPAITAVSSGMEAKIITNLCAQSHGLMTNDKSIKSLKDIKKDDKIALVNTGSIQHILLSMAAKKALGDAHALDNNIQPMAHAEGMSALQSGTVKLHLTSAPFIQQERADSKYSELKELSEVWPEGNSFLVALAGTKLQKDNPKLFDAVKRAFADAIAFLNNNKDEAVSIETKYLGLDVEVTTEYINDPTCKFFGELKGADAMLSFMKDSGFIEKDRFDNVKTVDDIKFDFVKSK